MMACAVNNVPVLEFLLEARYVCMCVCVCGYLSKKLFYLLLLHNLCTTNKNPFLNMQYICIL